MLACTSLLACPWKNCWNLHQYVRPCRSEKNRVSDHLTPDGETQFDGAGEADEGERPKPRGSWSIQSGAVHCPQADATVWVKRNVL